MKKLEDHLRTGFPFIYRIDAAQDAEDFSIHLDPQLQETAPVVKALHHYLEQYIQQHEGQEANYTFRIFREEELLDVLKYNDPDHEFHITINISGKLERLRIRDLSGGTGDYAVFNENFEKIGSIHTDQAPDFTSSDHWSATENLSLYLDTIITRISEQLEMNAEGLEIDAQSEEDLSFWSEQFQISKEDLKKAILAAGPDVEAITLYLQG
ncbi:MAG: DUF3606 domain-containing protein [Bacteroidota bacterium]